VFFNPDLNVFALQFKFVAAEEMREGHELQTILNGPPTDSQYTSLQILEFGISAFPGSFDLRTEQINLLLKSLNEQDSWNLGSGVESLLVLYRAIKDPTGASGPIWKSGLGKFLCSADVPFSVTEDFIRMAPTPAIMMELSVMYLKFLYSRFGKFYV
jgi:hypothetical protein